MTGRTRGDGTHLPGRLPQPTRRTVLGLGYAAALATAAACGLRVDLPQPPPPVPTRRPVPDEKLLIAVVRNLDGLAAQAAAVSRPGGSARTLATLRALLTEQARVLTGRLTNDGVPTDAIRPTTTAPAPAGGTATRTAAAPAAPTPVMLGAYAEQLSAIAPAHWAAVTAAIPGNRDLVLAVDSVRLAGGLLLGEEVSFGSPSAPARPHLAERTAPLVYGFEVVAAQSDDAPRTRALAALDGATDLLHALGGTSDAAPGGWSLPFPVTTEKEATRLGRHLLTTAIAAAATEAERTPDARSLDEIARWSARVQVIAARWGLPLTAFPGMTT